MSRRMRPIVSAVLGLVTLIASAPAFAQPGTITGTVTADGGSPLQNISVEFYPAAGGPPAGIALTTSNGSFSSPPLAAGTYFIRTRNNQRYVDEVYNNIPCSPFCALTSGASVTLIAGGTAAGVDLALTLGGRITGRVTNVLGAALPNVSVQVAPATGFSSSFPNNASGNYASVGLLPGNYFVRTSNSQGYIDEFYNNFVCLGCPPASGDPVIVSAGADTTIDFALAPGGRISGTVSAVGGAGLSGITIQVFTSNGTFVTSTPTAAGVGAGSYTTGTGLPSGNYFLRTFNNQGYIDELFDDVSCVPNCVVTGGVPVTVNSPATTSGIDFALNIGGRISGTVSGPSGPLANIFVQVFHATGTFIASIPTGPTGTYTTGGGLPTGSYFIRTSNGLGFIDELYDNIPCFPGCQITSGTAVSVTAGATTPDINFTLALGARITGSVKNTSAAPLSPVFIQLFNAAGTLLFSVTTNLSGAFSTPAIQPGIYYVRTSNSLGYLDQLYEGFTCTLVCVVTAGRPVSLAAGDLFTVNFTLVPGGQVSGTVTGGSNLLANVTIQVLNSGGAVVRSTVTNAGGMYAANGLPSDSYYVRTVNNQGYIDEMHDDVSCFPCEITTGTAVAVVAGGADAVVNFDLIRGGQIAGRVTDTSVPPRGVDNVAVQVFDAAGRTIGFSSRSAGGGFYSSTGFPAGTYFARVLALPGTFFIPELYDDIPCASCRTIDGTPIALTVGATVPIDFSLDTGGRISGTVIDAATGVPLSGMFVDVVTATGATTASFGTTTNGTYSTFGLPQGTYFARARALSPTPASSRGYINEVYDNLTCSGCNPPIGSAIAVATGVVTANIDFALARGARIAGQVREESADGRPISNVTVTIFNERGLQASTGATDASGAYTTPDGLAPGTYYARTANGLGYINELFNDLPCAGLCTATGGTAIDVSGTGIVHGADFELVAGGRIAGRVTDRATGLPLNGVTVLVNDATSSVTSAAISGVTGSFITAAGLPSASYFAMTRNGQGYINEAHDDTVCLGCTAARSGDPIGVTLGSTAGGIDFALDKGSRIAGTVTTDTLQPLSNVSVEVYANGVPSPAATAVTREDGTYVTNAGLPEGSVYTARTINALGFVNELYNEITCTVSCAPRDGTPIAVVVPLITLGIDFTLMPDADDDDDGIANTIDTDPAFSDSFSDGTQGGATSGVISDRGGWSVSVSDTGPGGVQARISGSGTRAAELRTCSGGTAGSGSEDVVLDANGEAARVDCAGSGTTTVRATAAYPTLQLRKTAGTLTTVAHLTTGQAVTLGSPAVADPLNTEPVHVTLLDQTGAGIGSFDLDPGESAAATSSSVGAISVTVHSGSVVVTVKNETVTVGQGQTHAFVLCTPLVLEQLTASPALLWPPNHNMVSVVLSPTLAGTCGTATCQIVSVTSSEEVDGIGDGDTSPDWEIGPGLTLKLRAERSGHGAGRTYTIVVRCTDDAGTVTSRTVTVSVPHDR